MIFFFFFLISRDTKNRAEIRDCPGKNGTSDQTTFGEPGTYNNDFERLDKTVCCLSRCDSR